MDDTKKSTTVLLNISIPWPHGNYCGPKLFDSKICSEREAHKFIEYIKKDLERTFWIFSNTSLEMECTYGKLCINIISDRDIIDAYKCLKNSLYVRSYEIFDILQDDIWDSDYVLG